MKTIILSNKRNGKKGLTIKIHPSLNVVYCGVFCLNEKPDIITSKKNIFKIIKKLKNNGYMFI